jgi:hypothetical protein
MHSGLVLICAVVWYGQDPDHPRAGMKEELKAWCQHHHCEALAQLAVFGPAREALKRDASVVPALEAVAEVGLSAETREVAAAALMALSDKELEIKAEGQKHVMLSCASTMLLLCSALWLIAAAHSSLHGTLVQTNGMCKPRL